MALHSFGTWKTDTGHELEYIATADNTPRLLGRLVTPESTAKPPLFSTRHPERLEAADVRPCDYSVFYAPVLDQGSHGSCVGHGEQTAFQRMWSMGNATRRDFSSCFLYGMINGNRDSGANLGDGINQLKDGGICLLTTVPEGMIYQRQFPSTAAAEAARFKLRVVYTLSSPQDIPTALNLGYTIATTLRVGSNFNNIDANGVPGIARGMGNHCVEVHGLVFLANGQMGYLAQNSWTTSWGVKGCMVLVDGHFNDQPGWEGYAYQAPAEDPDETYEPPIAPTFGDEDQERLVA